MRIYHDQALFKGPGGGHTPWHCDQVRAGRARAGCWAGLAPVLAAGGWGAAAGGSFSFPTGQQGQPPPSACACAAEPLPALCPPNPPRPPFHVPPAVISTIAHPPGLACPARGAQFYWPLGSDKTVTAWVPLVPVPEGRGPLQFAAGSQRHDLGRAVGIG